MSFRFTEDDLFADLTMTEFLVATIATELTVRETVQLKSRLISGDIMGGGVGVDLCVEDGGASRVYLGSGT